jgi:hypothetical protein
MKKKILIAVKTYPNPSKSYNETVCTAGLDEDKKKEFTQISQITQIKNEKELSLITQIRNENRYGMNRIKGIYKIWSISSIGTTAINDGF